MIKDMPYGSSDPIKYNPYRPSQVMDGDVLVGTIEREPTAVGYGANYIATVAQTGETEWFSTKAAARDWLHDQRGEMTLADQLELRFQWNGYDDDY